MFRAACDGYLSRKAWAGPTTVDYVRRWRKLWGDLDVREVDAELVNDWLDDRLSAVHPSTARRELNSLMAVIEHARARGWVDAVPGVARPADGEPRLRWLSDAEVEALLGRCEPLARVLVTFLLNTGARLGEAVQLTWADVKDDHVVLRTRKGRRAVLRERRVPLNGDARAALIAAKVGFGDERGPFPWASGTAAAYHVVKAADAAGVEDFQVHDLRRTFATRLLARGVNPRTVAELLGHSGLQMVMRYAVPPERLKVDAVEALGRSS